MWFLDGRSLYQVGKGKPLATISYREWPLSDLNLETAAPDACQTPEAARDA